MALLFKTVCDPAFSRRSGGDYVRSTVDFFDCDHVDKSTTKEYASDLTDHAVKPHSDPNSSDNEPTDEQYYAEQTQYIRLRRD